MSTHSHHDEEQRRSSASQAASSKQSILPTDATRARWLGAALPKILEQAGPLDNPEALQWLGNFVSVVASFTQLESYPSDSESMLFWQWLRSKCLAIGFDPREIFPEMPHWLLVDVNLAHEEELEFPPPSREERENCGAQELVLLGFLTPDVDRPAQSYLVEIEEHLGGGSYRGRLRSEPEGFEGLEKGQQFEFHAGHILWIFRWFFDEDGKFRLAK